MSKEKIKIKNKKIVIEFDYEHLPILIDSLETYSRLQSGQVGTAMDTVYADRNLTWDERQHIEGTVRYMAFPPSPRRKYDGHGGFYDQYNNEYDESGNLIKEGEDWSTKKNRPHLDHNNSYFGVGCPEMKGGTVAWEIKKAIEQYLHYERNDGYRDLGVDGDGPLNISGIPSAKILDSSFQYWKPEKKIQIPNRYQEKIREMISEKNYKSVWDIVEKAFKKNGLPRGSSYSVEFESGKYFILIENPYLNK